MKEDSSETVKKINEKRPMDDILNIIKQFVGYFEEINCIQKESQSGCSERYKETKWYY